MSELIEILFPKDTQEGTQSFLSKWIKKVGDTVSAHEPIAEISTDKVIVEVSSPTAGVICSLSVNENDEVKPGDVLGMIDPSASSSVVQNPASDRPSSAPSTQLGAQSATSDATSDLSPAVRKLLREHNLAPSQIKGSGKGGRITTDDILSFVSSKASSGIASTKIPHSPMRKTIAHHLAESLLTTAPHVTTVFECDFTEMLKHKAKLETTGQKVTLTAYFVRALVKALQSVPEANSRWHNEALEIFSDINVGIGTATPDGGLIVPVLHKAQEMSIAQIAARLADVTSRARDNSLTREDITGGTITISNYGVSGSLFATPIIINQPQSAILGVGKLEKRTKVISDASGDRIEIRPLSYVTLTIDHRVLDGFQANSCMTVFKEWIESGVANE